jgi:hypothetical protein
MVGFTFPPTWQKNNALSLSEFQRLQDSFWYKKVVSIAG